MAAMTARAVELASRKGMARRQQADGCLVPVIFLLFLLAGTLIFYFVFWEPVWGTVQATRWAAMRCVIVSSRVQIFGPGNKEITTTSKGDSVIGGKRYVPEVRYAYRHNNTAYHSTRIWFVRPAFDTLHEAEAVVARYPKGRETVCYVDPGNPAFAVLERGFKPDLLIASVPVGLAIVGLVGLVMSVGPRLIPPRVLERWEKQRAQSEESGKRRGAWRVYAPGGPFGFQPHHDGMAMPFFVAFAIGWNILIVFLVREVFDAWQAGIPGCYGWLLTLFSLPLLLVGLAAVIPPVYRVMKLLSPRPALILSSTTVPLGGEISVGWKIWWNAGRVRRLRVFLEGREEATYTRNENTYTDYEVFAMIPLADTTTPRVIRSGRRRLKMPADGVPTFCGEHNRIVWALRIHGQTKGWPDVDEEFEVKVGKGES